MVVGISLSEVARWRRSTRAIALLFLVPLLLPSASQASQVESNSGPLIRGVVTDQESGIPLATVAVSILSEDGGVLGMALTDREGAYLLPAPRPGSYRVRAERVSYQPQERGPFTLQATDTLTVDFQLLPAPFLLDSILVSVRRQGRTIGAGEQLVYGRLLDHESGEPIPQGMVQLMSASQSEAATTLSNDYGLFWLVSPNAGSYRLRAERIGYRPSEGPEFRLMLGDTLGVDFYL